MKLTFSISEIIPYINWVYFYHAWGISARPEADKQKLRDEAEAALSDCQERYQAYALFRLFDAYSDGDDIVVSGKRKEESGKRIPLLRQQQAGSEFLCLADYISPLTSHLSPLTSHLSPLTSQIGVFVTSVSHGLETDFDADPYQKMMMQLLADRLAEAAAERMHELVRKDYWGYAPEEDLTVVEMHQERFLGIRPAVGYPSLPDASLNFVIDSLLDFSQIGVRLTEHGAMKPHASVSGLMMAHPQAHYFSIGKIGEDQLRDYARRRGLPVEYLRRFLAANL
jgi:cobalamin-dependent methionine synthase I